jgi:hypothetical protein
VWSEVFTKMATLFRRIATSFTDRVEGMVRKRIYFLTCNRCRELAVREVWFSEEPADFAHYCLSHWEEFSVDGEYLHVYTLRS